MQKVNRWLDAIGEDAQNQIRKLVIELHCEEREAIKTYIGFVDHLHAILSDSATVTYQLASQTIEHGILWELGKMFYDRDSMRVPHFDHPMWTMAQIHKLAWTFPRRPGFHIPREYRELRPCLTFGPGLGWFGGKDRTGQRK